MLNEYEITLVFGPTKTIMHRAGRNVPELKPNEDYSEEWLFTAWYSEEQELEGIPKMERNIVLPSDIIAACIRDAAAQFKIKGGGGKSYKSIVASGIIFKNEEFIVNQNGQNLTMQMIKNKKYLMSKQVKIKSSRVNRTRAIIPPGCKVSIKYSIQHKDLTEEKVKQIFEHAGVDKGIGDWRPSAPKPGPYGQFTVI
jgi:hypothetical protein